MGNIDINKLSKKELEDLLQASKRQLNLLESEAQRPSIRSSDERVVAIADEVRQLAEALKLPRKAVFRAVAGNLRISIEGGQWASSAGIMYRDPDDPRKTWTGKGARPKWLKEELGKGRSLDEFTL